VARRRRAFRRKSQSLFSPPCGCRRGGRFRFGIIALREVVLSSVMSTELLEWRSDSGLIVNCNFLFRTFVASIIFTVVVVVVAVVVVVVVVVVVAVDAALVVAAAAVASKKRDIFLLDADQRSFAAEC